MAEGKSGYNRSFAFLRNFISSRSTMMMTLMGFIMIVALVTDLLISAFLDTLDEQIVPLHGVAIFISLAAAIYGSGQYLLTKFIGHLSKDIRNKSYFFRWAYRIVTLLQYVLAALFAIISLEILFASIYHTALLTAAAVVSLGPATLIMAIHCYRFFSWFKIPVGKNSIFALLYGIPPGLTSVAIAVMIYIDTSRIATLPPIESPADPVTLQLISSLPTLGSLFIYAYVLPLTLSLIIIWAGTAKHLRYYYKKTRSVKYWAIICSPAASFVVVLVLNIWMITDVRIGIEDETLRIPRFILFSSIIISVILIGISFLTMARNVPPSVKRAETLRGYLTMAGLGVMAQSIALTTFVYGNYPPFGILGHSFLALASYMYSLGLYSSAISLSEDIELRRSIKKFASKGSLLDDIGTAQMFQQLQTRIVTMVNKNSDAMIESTGIHPSISEQEAKEYLQEVLDELKSNKATETTGENS